MPACRRIAVVVTIGALATVTGCSSDQPRSPNHPRASSDHSIAVTVTGDRCRIADTELPAGVLRFEVSNTGGKTTEFYLYRGPKVVAEVENIAPDTTRDLAVDLEPGRYEGVCKPGDSRIPITVTGAVGDRDPKLAKAVADYKRYVATEADQLVAGTEKFVRLIKHGDQARAKELFPVVRTHWERIEPVAEIFGDLDPAIDGRETDLAPGQEFTGFHRLEKDLWVSRDLSRSGATADRLLADVKRIVALAKSEQLTPLQLANGSKELLDEVATTKITGEEDRYSHTDLWDFAANVEGARAAIEALRPVIKDRAPTLLAELDKRFADVAQVLRLHRDGTGYQLHTALSRTDLKRLSDVINALGEPVSKVAAIVAVKS